MTPLNFATLQQRRGDILALCQLHHASKVRVFGSIARGENRQESDVDLLIDFPDDKSVLDYIALQRELEILLSRKVDLVISECLHPLIKEQVLRESQVL